MPLTLFLLCASLGAGLAAPPFVIETVHGRCLGCQRTYQLGRFQFPSAREGWATAFGIVVSSVHVTQNSTVLHTHDGGKTWRAVKGIETYGVDVEPAFWFVNAMQGWIGWPSVSDGEDHFLRTADGGRHWRRQPVRLEGMWAHLRFFGPILGCAAISTMSGPRFYVTHDGGATWSSRVDDELASLTYPDALQFVNPAVGWLGSSISKEGLLYPRLLSTMDGGQTWQSASLPVAIRGTPHDLFFLDADHGWLILWNGDESSSVLLRTMNGGRTWLIETDPQLKGRTLNAVRFLSTTVGIVFASASGEETARQPSADHACLLVTSDGGESWRPYSFPSTVQSCEIVTGEIWCSSGMDILKVRPLP